MSAGQKAALVLIPFPIPSHHDATVQLAELLVGRNPCLSVTIIIMKLPLDTKTSTKRSPNPRIDFEQLPEYHDPGLARRTKSAATLLGHFVETQTGAIRDAVKKVADRPESGRLAGFIVDMFCTAAIDVAHELGLPSYIFFTCGAASLGLYFHLQGLCDSQNWDLNEHENSDVEVVVPTYANPVPARVWPAVVFQKESNFLNFTRKFRETKGIIINTFLEFEHRAIEALSAGQNIPPVYPVGPIIPSGGGIDCGREKHDEIMKWLDGNPDSSVVFVCFGSRGYFGAEQVKEIAGGLERSRQRFLWSLRRPPPEGTLDFPGEYEDPAEVLPLGFLERTAGIGKVIGWAPQVAVLSHRAVGGFVTHCGWNSVLESVWCGVPMATWPLAAEQQANAFQLVTELGIAVEIKMDYNENTCNVIVPAEKIGKAVREVMDRRAKATALREKSRAVMAEGGSSYHFLGRLIDSVLG